MLVVAAIDRMGRRYLETMWAIYDLQRRGIRLRSLADNEVQWTQYLDADLDSPETFMGNVLASMAAYVASQQVMRDGLLRVSEASALTWGNIELHEDGSGRLHVTRSKTDQTAEDAVLYLGLPASRTCWPSGQRRR